MRQVAETRGSAGGQDEGGDIAEKGKQRETRVEARPKLPWSISSQTRRWDSKQRPSSGNWGMRSREILVHEGKRSPGITDSPIRLATRGLRTP